MEKENKVIGKMEQYQKESKKEKSPLWTKIIIITGILLFSYQTLLIGRGTSIVDYILQVMGSIVGMGFIAYIIGLVPRIILKRRSPRAESIIFSISFLLLSIISLLGSLYRG